MSQNRIREVAVSGIKPEPLHPWGPAELTSSKKWKQYNQNHEEAGGKDLKFPTSPWVAWCTLTTFSFTKLSFPQPCHFGGLYVWLNSMCFKAKFSFLVLMVCLDWSLNYLFILLMPDTKMDACVFSSWGWLHIDKLFQSGKQGPQSQLPQSKILFHDERSGGNWSGDLDIFGNLATKWEKHKTSLTPALGSLFCLWVSYFSSGPFHPQNGSITGYLNQLINTILKAVDKNVCAAHIALISTNVSWVLT